MATDDLLTSLDRGIASAAGVLGELSRGHVSVSAAEVRDAPVTEVMNAIGAADLPVIAVYIGFDGGLSGHALLLMAEDGARRVARHLLWDLAAGDLPAMGDVHDPDALSRSALEELGNILISAVLNEVGRPLAVPIQPTVPRVVTDMAGAILSSVVVDLVADVDEVTVARSTFTEAGDAFDGWLFILPRRSPAGVGHAG
jgi:chemotaxis protein CheC